MDKIKEKEIVMTSRVRIARNLKNYKFPMKMSNEDANRIIEDTNNAINSENANYKLFYMKDLSDIEKNVLIEKHLMSPALSKNKDSGALILSPDEKSSIMVNEEDHIRIQTLGSGMCLNECWENGTTLDDILEESLEFAFDKELGYITSCPTNVGTGMRASVMLHLPALSITNQIDKLLYAVSQLGVAVRGVYGEGTKSMGHLYQISNQVTLGASEEKLIDKITQIVIQVIQKEKITRDILKKNNKEEIEDEIYRALGLLSYARSISTDEAMRLISYVKLGREIGVIEGLENIDLYDLMLKVQPNNLLSSIKGELTVKERDIKRAEFIRKAFQD